jgi:hypothetical protein
MWKLDRVFHTRECAGNAEEWGVREQAAAARTGGSLAGKAASSQARPQARVRIPG